MHILIITPYFAPDIGPSAPLFSLLSSALSDRGKQVTVISAIPHFATGKTDPNFRKKLVYRSIEDNINIVRVFVPSLDRSKLGNRLIQFIFFQIGATFSSALIKYDVGIITNPALETLLPFLWHAILRKKPIIWSVFDVYPEIGIKLGIFKNTFIINIVASIENICLQKAKFIQIISESFRKSLQKFLIPNSKISLIPIWTDTDFIHPLSKNNSFAREHHLDNKFVILYAGNIGLSQGLENLLRAAEILKAYEKIQIIMVGNGAGLLDLQSQVHKRNITNVQFIPFQPRERLPEVLASADVSLVILKRGIGADSLPSKTYSILASGRPIIASVDPSSETCHLILQADAGVTVPPEDPDQIAKAILTLMGNEALRKQLGVNGRDWAIKNHSVQSATEKFEELFIKANETVHL